MKVLHNELGQEVAKSSLSLPGHRSWLVSITNSVPVYGLLTTMSGLRTSLEGHFFFHHKNKCEVRQSSRGGSGLWYTIRFPRANIPNRNNDKFQGDSKTIKINPI